MKELYPWQTESWRALRNLRARLPHALLIKGNQGIGKQDLALNFSRALLCQNLGNDGMACGVCDSCRWFDQGNHPDFRLVQPKAQALAEEGEEKTGSKKPSREITIEQIRELTDFYNLSAHCGGYRIVMIAPAETMNHNAANALLKMLEEPTSKLLYLLITHKPQRLLPTILSRSLDFTVPTPPPEISAEWLGKRGVKTPDSVLAQAGFAPLQALDWAESGEGVQERNTLLQALHQPERLDALTLAEQLQRSSPSQLIHCLQQWNYDLLSAKLAGKVRYFPEQYPLVKGLATTASMPSLLRFQQDLHQARRAANHPLNSRLVLESLLLSYRQLFGT